MFPARLSPPVSELLMITVAFPYRRLTKAALGWPPPVAAKTPRADFSQLESANFLRRWPSTLKISNGAGRISFVQRFRPISVIPQTGDTKSIAMM